QFMSNDIKTFVEKEFAKRRTKKPRTFYKKLVYFHKSEPVSVFKIIDKLHVLGYWKDYLHLLKYVGNLDNEMSKHIINILKNQLLNDINNYNRHAIFSTLAKWLPRKKMLIKNNDFVFEFSKIIY